MIEVHHEPCLEDKTPNQNQTYIFWKNNFCCRCWRNTYRVMLNSVSETPVKKVKRGNFKAKDEAFNTLIT